MNIQTFKTIHTKDGVPYEISVEINFDKIIASQIRVRAERNARRTGRDSVAYAVNRGVKVTAHEIG